MKKMAFSTGVDQAWECKQQLSPLRIQKQHFRFAYDWLTNTPLQEAAFNFGICLASAVNRKVSFLRASRLFPSLIKSLMKIQGLTSLPKISIGSICGVGWVSSPRSWQTHILNSKYILLEQSQGTPASASVEYWGLWLSMRILKKSVCE